MPFRYPSGGSNARYEPTGEKRNGRPLYCVTARFSYLTEIDGEVIEIVVPPGFVTDLASIPSLPFLPNPGGTLWDDAAIVHDVALITWPGPRREADLIFYHALRERGCNAFTARIFWAAVRINSILKGKA